MSGAWDAAGPEARLADRIAARRFGRPRAPARFRAAPEPVFIGRPERGRRLVEGRLSFEGETFDLPAGATPWVLDLPPGLAAELHRFAWLDDLAALGGRAAWAVARGWTTDWIARFGGGSGPGWTAARAGRRAMAWIDHAEMVEAGPETRGHDEAFRRSLGGQARFLVRRWPAAPPGPPRVEALCGLLRAGLALSGAGLPVAAAAEALAREAAAAVDDQGGLPSRDPERLMQLHARLCWAAAALEDAKRAVPTVLGDAIARAAPVLRTLRHADGGLVRMHGGGAGVEGRLDLALARGRGASRRGGSPGRLAMGFARLSEARVTVIADAAAPATGYAGRDAHASTLAIEVTAGRHPLIVSCGPGSSFGADWRRMGRETDSHSALSLDGVSSSRLGAPQRLQGRTVEPLDHGPREVARAIGTRRGAEEGDPGALVLDMSHDGWRESHGLICRRIVSLRRDGREVSGEEALVAETDRDLDALIAAVERTADRTGDGIGYAVRFHLHPDAEVSADDAGIQASVTLRSGQVWALRHDGVARLSVEPSVFFDAAVPAPRPSRQVVLSGRIEEAATHLRWSLARVGATEPSVRRLDRGLEWGGETV